MPKTGTRSADNGNKVRRRFPTALVSTVVALVLLAITVYDRVIARATTAGQLTMTVEANTENIGALQAVHDEDVGALRAADEDLETSLRREFGSELETLKNQQNTTLERVDDIYQFLINQP